MSDHRPIPAAAWQGVRDPPSDFRMQCPTCGNEIGRAMSIADAFSTIPQERIVNGNTFMIPNFAWGYLSCERCETEEAERQKATQSHHWWLAAIVTRLFGSRITGQRHRDVRT